MFHLAANFVALANVANTQVPALNDQVLNVINNNHAPSRDMMILAAYASAVTMTFARLNTPHVRKITYPFVSPIGVTLLPPTNPNVAWWMNNPIVAKRDEQLQWEATDSAAGPNNAYVLSWLTEQLTPAPAGECYQLVGTSTTAAVASTWTLATMVWQTTLPEGIYAVVGGQYIATNAIAFNLIFEGQYYRPGGLGGATAGVRPPWWQQKGGLGEWGRFRSVVPPMVNVLSNGADAAHTLILDIVRVGGTPIL